MAKITAQRMLDEVMPDLARARMEDEKTGSYPGGYDFIFDKITLGLHARKVDALEGIEAQLRAIYMEGLRVDTRAVT